MKSAQELINRGNNLFICGFMAVTGLEAIPELPTEGGLKGALDESVIVLLALGAIAWFVRNRYNASWYVLGFPLGFMAAKVVALLIEAPDDRGDDIGAVITMAVLIVTWAVIRWRTREVTAGQVVASNPA